MEFGYLCPDFTFHEGDLLEWEGDIRNMKCKKCGNIAPAMAKIDTLTNKPIPQPKN